MSASRRVMRFGTIITLALGIIKMIKQHNTVGPVRMLVWRILQYLFLCGFLIIDHALFFTANGVTKIWDAAKIKNATWWAIFSWLLSCVCEAFVHSAYI